MTTDKNALAQLSGEITRACLDNGMSTPDACETAAVVLPVVEAFLEGSGVERA